MSYNYPNSPTIGQIFQGWIWDGEKWNNNTYVPSPATALPIIEGTVAVGTSTNYAREDHIHPAYSGGGGGTATSVSFTPAGNIAATNVQTAIVELDSEKEPTITGGTTAQYWRGDKTWQTTPLGDVTGPAGAVADRIATFNGATGKIIKDGGTLISALQPANQAVRYDTVQGLTVNQMAQARSNIAVTKKNYIINGAFTIQQDTTYVSNAVLAAGAYGHDQWKAGAAGGDYTFTQLKSSTTITIKAGKSLIQPIEDVMVVGGGNYVLAWTGTAQARAGVNTLTPSGAYAASPLLITGQTDGTVMSVEFNAGTLSGVSLTEGNVAPPFQMPDYAEELRACQRYWQIGVWGVLGSAGTAGTTNIGERVTFPVPMRIAPSASANSVANGNATATTTDTITATSLRYFASVAVSVNYTINCYTNLNARL